MKTDEGTGIKAPREEEDRIIAQGATDVNRILGRQASEVLPVCLCGRQFDHVNHAIRACARGIFSRSIMVNQKLISRSKVEWDVPSALTISGMRSGGLLMRGKVRKQGAHRETSPPTSA